MDPSQAPGCVSENAVRAVVFDKKLRFEEHYPVPMPGQSECLIRVHYAGICATDLEIIQGYLGFQGVLGHEMVGTVVHGPAQWRDKRVACEINCACTRCDMCLGGLANHCRKRTVLGIAGRDGCFADFVALPERNLHALPDTISDEEAVFIEPIAAAYQVRAQCPVDVRSSVAVLGAGKLGLLVAQVLSKAGCQLVAIGRNRIRLLHCEKHGVRAIHVEDLVPRQEFDVVVECTGSPDGLDLAMKLVRPRGTIVLKSTYANARAVNPAPLVINEITLLGSRCGPFAEAILALDRKEVDVRPYISRIVALQDITAAMNAATNHDNVKIILKINPR